MPNSFTRIGIAAAIALSVAIVIGLPEGADVSAQAKPAAEVRKSGAGKNTPKVDRRDAVTRGAWSAATVSLFNTWSAFDENPDRHASFASPDGRKMIEVVGEEVFLRIGDQRFRTGIDNDTKHDAELGWAPDSTKFFITWTETGELGPWDMQVYGVDESGVHEFPEASEPARKDFEKRVRQWPIDPELNDSPQARAIWSTGQYCEPYNVIGGRWLNGSQEILLSVLVSNTSDCRYMSEFNVYRVNAVSGQILQRFTAKEAHKRFGDKYLPRIVR